MKVSNFQVWNTKEKGIYKFFIYPEKPKHYIGVCLTLDIVEEGPDPRVLLNSLIEAMIGHVKTVIKENLGEELLNRPAPQEYWDKYERFKEFVEKKKEMKKIPSFLSGATAHQKVLESASL